MDHTRGGLGAPPAPLSLGGAVIPRLYLGFPPGTHPTATLPEGPHPGRHPARCPSRVPAALDSVPCNDSAHSPCGGGLGSERTDRRSSKPVSLAAAAAQTGHTVAGDTWRAGANRVRLLPAPPRPAPPRVLHFWSQGVTSCRGRAWGRALSPGTCCLLPGAVKTPDLTPPERRGLGKSELEVKLMSCSGHFLPHSCPTEALLRNRKERLVRIEVETFPD